MGSWVVGYQLTCYTSFNQLLAQTNDFQTQEWYENGIALLNSILPLSAIFGTSTYTKEPHYIAASSNHSVLLTPSAT